MLIHFVGVFPADVDGFIGAEAVHDDDFVTPLDAFKTTADPSFLVKGYYTGGNLVSHSDPFRKIRCLELWIIVCLLLLERLTQSVVLMARQNNAEGFWDGHLRPAVNCCNKLE